MPSLYEILEVPPTATKAEIKRAYKAMALKTHPDRVPPEQKAEADAAFQKINAAYEVLSNDTARHQYDTTGRIPTTNSDLGSTPPQGPPGFFTPFGAPIFGFGADSHFNDQRFGAGFNTPFFTSSAFGAFDPFVNDPFFNPRARGIPRATGGFGGFPFDSMFHGFGQPASSFGGSRHGSSLYDSPPFPFDMNQQSSGNSSSFQSFFSSTTTTYRDGKWTSESVEESNINGERKKQSQRVWMDEEGNRHAEQTGTDGSRQYLRDGRSQPSRALPPLVSDSAPPAGHSSRSSRSRA